MTTSDTIFETACSALRKEGHFSGSELSFITLFKTGKAAFRTMAANPDGTVETSSTQEVDVTPIDWADPTLCFKHGHAFIQSIKRKYPWRSQKINTAKKAAKDVKAKVRYVGGNGYDSSGLQKVISMVIRQRELRTKAKYAFGKQKQPTAAKVGKISAPPQSELEARCLAYDAEVMATLPMNNVKTVREVVAKANSFIAVKEEEGDESVVAIVIFLGRIPELANMPHEMTTNQVLQYIKDKFKVMKPSYFRRGWYGIEGYFKEHPKGAETHGYIPKKGWMSVDHVLAQYFGMFHHPRFYALMPPAINCHLRENPPITRMGFGITRHEMGLMHTWMKHIEKTAREKNIQNLLLDNLVKELPVERPA